MTIRQLKLLCWTISAVLCAGALAVVLAAMILPLDAGAGSDDDGSHVSARSSPRAAEKLTMLDFEPYLAGTLRRAVETAAPVVQATETAPAPVQTVELELKGTIVEANNCIAIIRAGENIEFKKLGETINDAEVTEISDGVAVLKRNGESMTLRVPLPPG